MSAKIQSKVRYAWYGDDFTGSTDVLEALALHSVPAVLFTDIPNKSDLAAFADRSAVGIAGESRSRPPAWMDEHLPPVFEAMRRLNAPIHHYKVCSTFDSSPSSGSIGRAMELGLRVFDSEFVPVVVTAPHLGRSVVYGNLFAAAGGVMYRIDRHPTMRSHPVTPMEEADLRLHLAKQTSLPVGLINIAALQDHLAMQHLESELAAGMKAVLFDGVSYSELDEAASLLWQRAAGRPVFAVGSSGLTYGMLRAWQHVGLAEECKTPPAPESTGQILVASGSCSPVTAAQIRDAQENGFATLRLNGGGSWQRETEEASRLLADGRSVILYTALGSERTQGDYGADFSAKLGAAFRQILLDSGVRRIAIAGGDTSSHVMRQLGARALTFAATLAPGAPLCRMWAPGSPLDGVEVVLKGGQVGTANFFTRVRNGS